MTATFFVDENDLALGKALAKLHGNVFFPGHPDLLTRDQRIRYGPVEKRMWVEHRVRGLVLTGTTSQSTAASLGLLEDHWEAMATIVEVNPVGPWMYAITEAGVAIVLS